MNSPEQLSNSFELSSEKSRQLFEARIVPQLYGEVEGVLGPIAHFIGGQPGAGKSTAQSALITDLNVEFGHSKTMEIGSDLYRQYHPEYLDLMRQGDDAMAHHTNVDAGRWMGQAIDLSLQRHPHVVLEGTLRSPDRVVSNAKIYAEYGFDAELHLMVVHEFVSRTRIFLRYFEQIAKRGSGRYTQPYAHDAAYEHLPESVNAILESVPFRSVTLYDMNGLQLLSHDDPASNGARSEVAQVLNEVRHGSVDTEYLLGQLNTFRGRAVEFGRETLLPDLDVLQQDIER